MVLRPRRTGRAGRRGPVEKELTMASQRCPRPGSTPARPAASRLRFAAALCAACLLPAVAARPAAADQIVYFVNGKAMTVRAVEKGERFTILEIEGGGRIGVPTEQIQRIEEYHAPAPQPVAVQQAPPSPHPGAVPAPVAAAVAPGVPTGGPPIAQPGLGPGLGGKATVAEGRGLAGLAPLPLGGAAAAAPGVPNRPAAGSAAGPGPQRPGMGGAFGRGGRAGFGRPGMGRPRPPLAAQDFTPPAGVPPPARFKYADPTDVPPAAEPPPPVEPPDPGDHEPNPPAEEQQEPQPEDPRHPEGDDPQNAPPER